MPTITFEHGEVEITLPAVWEVCSTCRGEGTTVNPAIDGHGITAEEWARDWDDESREEYFSGAYDVPCRECGGNRVVAVPDETRANPDDLAAYYEHQRAEAEYRQWRDAERRMGA